MLKLDGTLPLVGFNPSFGLSAIPTRRSRFHRPHCKVSIPHSGLAPFRLCYVYQLLRAIYCFNPSFGLSAIPTVGHFLHSHSLAVFQSLIREIGNSSCWESLSVPVLLSAL